MKNQLKKLSIITSIALLAIHFQACNVNEAPPRGNATRDYGLTDFDRLEMGSAFSIVIRQGAAFSVEAHGELNDLDDLEIYVENSSRKLKAGYRNRWRNRRPMEITITMPVLREVEFSGATKSDIEGFENLDTIEFELSGASKSYFRGSSREIEADLSGASELTLEGQGNRLEIDLSGASDFHAYGYPVKNAEVELSGASRSRTAVSDRLKVQASGASKVYYKGSPSLDQNLSGASTITKE